MSNHGLHSKHNGKRLNFAEINANIAMTLFVGLSYICMFLVSLNKYFITQKGSVELIETFLCFLQLESCFSLCARDNGLLLVSVGDIIIYTKENGNLESNFSTCH